MNTTTERTGPKAGPGTIARKFEPNPTEHTRTTRRNLWRNRIHLTRIAKRVDNLEKRIARLETTIESHIAAHSERGE